ncbi:MAG: hypothetical protein JETT_2612 [Candidatus Jettenia ecosi]|uniref:Uncharacterized protein n=1 Tax=Candidatus Jettenia ecosi TaxID=2494326 RepID=A0A533Q8Y1_9BACT|nr:MAG: hypothetical protein JETT_2612 [Candidatus Jettenia ecosi]
MFAMITEKRTGKKIFIQLSLKENLSNVSYYEKSALMY